MPSKFLNHAEMVRALVKPGVDIILGLTAGTVNLLHMAVGVSGESGELLDAVKKAAIYNKPLDLHNVIEELGDLEFYMEGIRQQLGITRDQCLIANMVKLECRYKERKYSDEAAQLRADKQEN
jgi:NTP pyrophosphatase (non-canonical NTP hydrolase)